VSYQNNTNPNLLGRTSKGDKGLLGQTSFNFLNNLCSESYCPVTRVSLDELTMYYGAKNNLDA
jgi:hypothetical protein